MAGVESYIICTTPRSGSTLLCSLLSATGIAGKPESYFHRASIADWASHVGHALADDEPEVTQLRRVFRAAIKCGRADTAVFGLRLQRESFPFFRGKLQMLYPAERTDTDRLKAAFGSTHFIHLTRHDKLAQAVSNVKARQTGLWHLATDGTELERRGLPGQPSYDADAIRSQKANLTALDQDWMSWFNSQSIQPMRIAYESLAADPLQVLTQVLVQLGLDPAGAAGVRPGVARLADATSRAWMQRFKSETA